MDLTVYLGYKIAKIIHLLQLHNHICANNAKIHIIYHKIHANNAVLIFLGVLIVLLHIAYNVCSVTI